MSQVNQLISTRPINISQYCVKQTLLYFDVIMHWKSKRIQGGLWYQTNPLVHRRLCILCFWWICLGIECSGRWNISYNLIHRIRLRYFNYMKYPTIHSFTIQASGNYHGMYLLLWIKMFTIWDAVCPLQILRKLLHLHLTVYRPCDLN